MSATRLPLWWTGSAAAGRSSRHPPDWTARTLSASHPKNNSLSSETQKVKFTHFHGFSILLQVKFERLHIIIKPKGGHSEENVLAIDCLPLLSLASLTRLTEVKIVLKGVFQ